MRKKLFEEIVRLCRERSEKVEDGMDVFFKLESTTLNEKDGREDLEKKRGVEIIGKLNPKVVKEWSGECLFTLPQKPLQPHFCPHQFHTDSPLSQSLPALLFLHFIFTPPTFSL